MTARKLGHGEEVCHKNSEGNGTMKKLNFDLDWDFSLNGATKKVNLPHDFSIELPRTPESRMKSDGGYFQGGNGIYKKRFFIPENTDKGTYIMEIEGAYMNTEVYVGPEKIAFHPYGYSTFHCDLTPFLKSGEENEIEIRTSNNALPNSRWYSGSGLYRHVWMLTSKDRANYITPWGVFVTTESADNTKALIKIETNVVCKNAVLRSTVMDGSGMILEMAETEIACGKSVQSIEMKQPKLWSVDHPFLYQLKSELIVGGDVIDEVCAPFGVRTIELNHDKGFLLNGEILKLRGGCVHHDCGILGAASYDRAEERKVEILKVAGYNAVRCAHNPPSPAFLDACDRLGMIVIDEAFDCWNVGKTAYDYHLYFDRWWMDDLKNMVFRDRNHPSIAFWSTGNEIPERSGCTNGVKISEMLAETIKECDSTRFITNALCDLWDNPGVLGDWGDVTADFAKPLDAAGYNYLWKRYEDDLNKFKDRFIIGTETVPAEAFENWVLAEKHARIIGDFVWTGIDYLGEAGIGHAYYPGEEGKTHRNEYPWHLANCGDIDICGHMRPQSYYRQMLWGVRSRPYIAVHQPNEKGLKKLYNFWGWGDVSNSWSFKNCEGFKTFIDVYCKCDEVELILNGKSLGRRRSSFENKYIASFETVYEPGELKAVGYLNGESVGEDIVKTCGEPERIELVAEKSNIKAVYGDLAYITAYIKDKNGRTVTNADNELYFTAYGQGDIAAIGTSDPLSEENYAGNSRKTYYGACTVVLRSDGNKGAIELSVCGDGLKPAQITIHVN